MWAASPSGNVGDLQRWREEMHKLCPSPLIGDIQQCGKNTYRRIATTDGATWQRVVWIDFDPPEMGIERSLTAYATDGITSTDHTHLY